jgi:hypothetical protein
LRLLLPWLRLLLLGMRHETRPLQGQGTLTSAGEGWQLQLRRSHKMRGRERRLLVSRTRTLSLRKVVVSAVAEHGLHGLRLLYPALLRLSDLILALLVLSLPLLSWRRQRR